MRPIDAQEIENILMYTEFDRRDGSPEWLKDPVSAYMHFLDIIQNAPTLSENHVKRYFQSKQED